MEKAYCVKCRSKQTWSGKPSLVRTTNNRVALSGKCNKCKTKMFRFVGKNELQNGSGLLGKLLGLPGGKIPVLSNIPLIGALL